MSFTYELGSDLGKLRLEAGDTVLDAGPRPGARNYADAEMDYFLSEEGTIGRATARACETLATEWSSQAGSRRLGPMSYARQQADAYRARAATLREQHGWPEGSAGQLAGWNTRIYVADA